MHDTTVGAPSAPHVSAANQWMACHGSYQAQHLHPGYPGEPSQSRLEGRACHEAAQLMFQAWLGKPRCQYCDDTGDVHSPDGEWRGTCDCGSEQVLFGDIVGRLSKDGIVITEDLFDVARVYVTDVIGYCSSRDLVSQLRVEERVPLDHLWPDWYGVPDAWVYDPETRNLVVWSLETGHTCVNAEGNSKLVLGAEGALAKLGMSEHDRQFVQFDLRIVQPRCYTSSGTIRSWQMASIYFGIAVQSIVNALQVVTGDTPPCKPGHHCRTCSARANCDALQRWGYEFIDYEQDLQTHNLSGHALGLELRTLRLAADAIKYRLSGLEEQALHELRNGQPVTWFAACEGKGRETWRKDVPTEQVIVMGDLMGVDLRKPVELKTPAQVRKLGLDESVIGAYSYIPSTGLKLVEVDGAEARRVFSNSQEK